MNNSWRRLVQGVSSLALFACTASVSVAADIRDAEGVLGWVTVTGSGWEVADSAIEACRIQFQSFTDRSHFIGTYPEFPYTGCVWHTALGDSRPASVEFVCEAGYTRLAPGRCVKEVPVNQSPQNCACTNEDALSGVEARVNPNGQTSQFAGNPIELFSGRKIERATDFSTADGLLHVTRRFSSEPANSAAQPMGADRFGGLGWSFDIGPTLQLHHDFGFEQSLSITLGDATSYQFKRNATTNAFEPVGSASESVALASRFNVVLNGAQPSNWSAINTQPSTWTVTDRDTGVTYTMQSMLLPNQTSHTLGHATQIKQRSGYQWDLSYGPLTELEQIKDSFDRELNFTYHYGIGARSDSEPVLIKDITLPDGTALQYDYSQPYRSRDTNEPTFVDLIVGVEHVASLAGSGPANVLNSSQYHYEDDRFPHFLTGITDHSGDRHATFAYDAAGRAISSKHGISSDEVTISYGAPSATVRTTTVSNAAGKQTILTYDKTGGQWLLRERVGVASADTPASTASFTYNGKLLASQTDQEGRVTTYARMSIGAG